MEKMIENFSLILLNNNNYIHFYISLRAELNSQWPVTESARIQLTTATRQHGTMAKTRKA
jgi:hypothetical protein